MHLPAVMTAIRSLVLPVLLILSVLHAPTVLAQDCDPSIRFERHGYPADMELDGDLLAIADGAGLTMVDLTDPLSPRVMSSISTPAESLAVVATGSDRVSVLTRGALHLYDTGDPYPRLLDSIGVDGTTLHRLGSALIVVGQRLTRLAVSGDSLMVTGQLELPGEPEAAAVVGDALFVSIPGYGTTRIDESLNQFGRIGIGATAIAGRDDMIFLGRGGDGLFAVDYSDPYQPSRIIHMSSGVAADELLLVGERLYAAGMGSLYAVDVSDPSAPVVVEAVSGEADVLESDGVRLYSYGNGLDRLGRRVETGSYLSIRDLTAPVLPVVATLTESTGPVSGVAVHGDTAWIADPPFVRAIDLTSGERLWSLRLDEPFDRVRFENDRLVLFGRAWVHLIDPYADTQKLLGSWDTKGIAGGGVTFSGPWLIEANKASGFHVLDISDPSNIYQRGGLINDSRGKWHGVVGMPGVVYGMVSRGVKVVALGSDPTTPEIVDFLPFGGIDDVEIVVAGDPYLLVLDGRFLRVHDLSVPLHPLEIAVIEVTHGSDLAVDGTRGWVLGDDGRILGVDLSSPAAPRLIGVHEGLRAGLAIDATDEVIVGADQWALWARPLTDEALSDVPALTLTSRDDGMAELRWESPPVSVTEVQLAHDPGFNDVDRTWVTAGELVTVERPDEPLWFRARFVLGCESGSWSPAVELEPDSRPGRRRIIERP